jgi:guanylate cyclase, other
LNVLQLKIKYGPLKLQNYVRQSIGLQALTDRQKHKPLLSDAELVITIVISVLCTLIVIAVTVTHIYKREQTARADAMWAIDASELTYDDPVFPLGKGTFGLVLRGYYRGTTVAIKKVITSEIPADNGFRKLAGRAGLARWASTHSFTRGKQNLLGGASSSLANRNVSLDTSELERRNTDTSNRGDATMSGANTMTSMTQSNLKKDFIREMRTLAKLRHPYIVTIMGAVTHGDEPLLVMECMANGSLHDLLHNETLQLDSELVLPMLRDILQGMRFLHAAAVPIVHGDLKSANVLVDSNFRAKVSDFGLSQKRKSGHMGTPYWMAPELLDGGDVSTASDVYAFGVTLWELMTRKSPYADIDSPHAAILQQIRHGTLRPDCSKGFEEELAVCMQKCWNQNPQERPTFEELEIKLIPLCSQNFFTSARRIMETNNKYRNDSAALLLKVFPKHVAEALMSDKKVEPEQHGCVTIFFSDIVGFTNISSSLSAQEVSEMLDRLYVEFDDLAGTHGVFKVETIGDAWMGVCNLDQPQPDHAARLVLPRHSTAHTQVTKTVLS